MASSSLASLTAMFTIIVLSLLDLSIAGTASSNICYKSIISFGDSLADTGNLFRLDRHSSLSNAPLHFFLPPYGESYFHHPTGRCSDGRLVIDFIAKSFGLPLTQPYFAGKDAMGRSDFLEGVNFAVIGATALDNSFFVEKGIHNPLTNVSLGTQLRWFKDTLRFFCKKPSAESFGLPLIQPYLAGKDVRGWDFGGGINFAVAGAMALDFSFLQERGIRNPATNVSLGTQLGWFKDVLLAFCSSSSGFTGGALAACCGDGGPYNYNSSVACGDPPATSCDDPSFVRLLGWFPLDRSCQPIDSSRITSRAIF